jgi:hypothetical protein
MGISAGDFDGDGDLDLCITDAIRGTYYRNNGTTLTEVTPFATFFGWGTTWLDVDNDGDLDNYQAGSHSTANVDHLTRNLGNGQWDDISAALNTTALPSQHTVQVDFNNDGRQDLITINPNVPSVNVYENLSTTGNHWLKLQLVGNGVTTNRSAIGAMVRITAGGKTQVREIISGSSTSATEDLRAHFGLGSAVQADRIEVVWPRQGTLVNRTSVYQGPFAADQILTLAQSPRPDLDGDSDVDQSDFGLFQACLTGPTNPQIAAPCRLADLNDDNVIDQNDLTILRGCASGPGILADPSCTVDRGSVVVEARR